MSAKEIIKAFPTPVKGGILSTIDKEACEKAVAQILKGGENVLRELVDLLIEPGKGNDVQARHALHATAIRVGGPTKTKQRKAFAKALASTLADDRPKAVKGFIEDRRPIANCDPYVVTQLVIDTVCSVATS